MWGARVKQSQSRTGRADPERDDIVAGGVVEAAGQVHQPGVARGKVAPQEGMSFSTRTGEGLNMPFLFVSCFVCLLYQIIIWHLPECLLFFHRKCIIVKAHYRLNSL